MAKSIVYTIHALERMSVRKVSKEMVQKAISEPEQIRTGYKGRSLAYKSYGDERIKVVYTEMTERFIVISVMWD